MTVVKKSRYAAESLVYLTLKNESKKQISSILKDEYNVNVPLGFVKSLKKQLKLHRLIEDTDGLKNPRTLPQNAWFDISSKNYAINVKHGYESSANSRIRDFTSEAASDLSHYWINKNLFVSEPFGYEMFRNQILHKISNDVKSRKFPIQIDDKTRLQIKMVYPICMSLIGQRNLGRNVYFCNFMDNFSPIIQHVSFFQKVFKINKFLKDLSFQFSNNSPTDPHKKTIKFKLCDKEVGFLELRTNRRVMLHLRNADGHWKNLMKLLPIYF